MAREASMTRRHFEFIANIINALDLGGCRGGERDYTPAEIRLRIAYDFARAMEGVNSAFNTKLFVDAACKRDMKKQEKLTKRAAAVVVKNYSASPHTCHSMALSATRCDICFGPLRTTD